MLTATVSLPDDVADRLRAIGHAAGLTPRETARLLLVLLLRPQLGQPTHSEAGQPRQTGGVS